MKTFAFTLSTLAIFGLVNTVSAGTISAGTFSGAESTFTPKRVKPAAWPKPVKAKAIAKTEKTDKASVTKASSKKPSLTSQKIKALETRLGVLEEQSKKLNESLVKIENMVGGQNPTEQVEFVSATTIPSSVQEESNLKTETLKPITVAPPASQSKEDGSDVKEDEGKTALSSGSVSELVKDIRFRSKGDGFVVLEQGDVTIRCQAPCRELETLSESSKVNVLADQNKLEFESDSGKTICEVTDCAATP